VNTQEERPTISIIIPAFNEAGRIGNSLRTLGEFIRQSPVSFEVIVVDDGCTDDTVQIAQRSGLPALRTVHNEINRGKGYSFRTGVRAARGVYVLLQDADSSAPIEQVTKLLEVAKKEKADVVIGSRNVDRRAIVEHQPLFREIGGFTFNFAVRSILGLNFRDTQCGFKLFHRENTLPIFERLTTFGFGFDPELLFLAKRSGLLLREVSVQWGHHREGSRFKPFHHGPVMFADLLRIRWLALTGRYSLRPDRPVFRQWLVRLEPSGWRRIRKRWATRQE
jgi:glycosyltransferase involved in cell wall biosynthesis